MKAAFILLSFFLLMVTFRAQAVSWSYEEKQIIESSKKFQDLYKFFIDKINPKELPIRDYLSFKLHKDSCLILKNKINEFAAVRGGDVDHSGALRKHSETCSKGIIGLAYLYSKQR